MWTKLNDEGSARDPIPCRIARRNTYYSYDTDNRRFRAPSPRVAKPRPFRFAYFYFTYVLYVHFNLNLFCTSLFLVQNQYRLQRGRVRWKSWSLSGQRPPGQRASGGRMSHPRTIQDGLSCSCLALTQPPPCTQVAAQM